MRLFVLIIISIVVVAVSIIAVPLVSQKNETNPKDDGVEHTFQSMVMPGPLIRAHEKYKADCTQCHAPFSKETQDNLCLSCHEDVGKDIKALSGFHGREPSVQEQSCKSCHTDHIGRDADIIALDERLFHHDMTDFKLEGAHTDLAVGCDDCHKAGKKFREAPSDCYSCHKEDDRHDGALGKSCKDCHKSTSWTDTFFDHDETDFKLEGEHKDVSCDACHLNETYKDTKTDCLSCHLINDIHDSAPQTKCDDCHNAKGWEFVEFDHDKDTDFKLKERHAKLLCEDCHGALDFKEELGSGCIDCHRADDIHKGRNGSKCSDCHGQTAWTKVTFNHDKDTDFALRGGHKDVTCDSCHKGSTGAEKLSASCVGCHKADDVHQGSLGKKCDDCHNEKGWSLDIAFDHDLTRFPLIGIHAVTSCGECHVTASFKDAKADCASCHKKDDTHKQALGNNCAGCHNPNDWDLWQFNHDTQTDFVLKGSHDGLVCSACHKRPVTGEIKMDKNCYACHANDNIHRMAFGKLTKRCDLCHAEEAFDKISEKQIKTFHRSPMAEQIGLSQGCADCHEKDDIHNGRFGSRCDRCHTVESFKDIRMGR